MTRVAIEKNRITIAALLIVVAAFTTMFSTTLTVLDGFVETMRGIAREAEENPEIVTGAPSPPWRATVCWPACPSMRVMPPT